ncbi:hypothetical protein AVEN_150775-1, partial [Araneus ventricosus]
YLVAKFQLLSAADLRGVNAFIAYIGMPGIICMTLADADFGDLRWELILGLFLGKLFVFVLVAGVSLRINGNVGVAGLLAIFCVHSNDLPVGNPLTTQTKSSQTEASFHGYQKHSMSNGVLCRNSARVSDTCGFCINSTSSTLAMRVSNEQNHVPSLIV